ncbi:MAG: ornithine carbamoyltransferase [Caldisericia bacterium]
MHRLYGRDLITIQEWSPYEVEETLEVAREMKRARYTNPYKDALKNRTFFMMFYNPSVRTRQSFETAATELGGHAQFLEPKTMRLREKGKAGETIEDAANVMSRYGVGIGIRILEDAIERYGDGDFILREYAKYATIPIISMAHDKYHPCQALADMLGLLEHLRSVKKKKLVMMWGYSTMVRSWSSVHANLLISSMFGMDIKLVYPPGYDLDPEVMEMVKDNAKKSGSGFEIIPGNLNDLRKALEGADVVYSRNWMSPKRYDWGKEKEIEMAGQFKDWILTKEFMKLTNDAYFIHPMPVDRGNEVEDEVASSKNSIIYDIAENRLHVQKAVMALTMGDL